VGVIGTVAMVLYLIGSACFFVGTIMMFGERMGWW
jgi:hypothetical protein